MSVLRPLKIRPLHYIDQSLPVPNWYFPYDIIQDIKTTSQIRPLLCKWFSYRDFTVLGRILEQVNAECQSKSMWSVAWENDNSACVYFLITCP